MDTAIIWFRRDLRLSDNPALQAALQRHDDVVCVYIHDLDGEGDWRSGAASQWWLHHSLVSLDADLRGLGGRLILRSGASLQCLRTLIAQCNASAVYWNRLYEPALIERDRGIKQALREQDSVIAESFNASLLFEPWSIKNGANEPYRVFTPYWRKANLILRGQLESGRKPLPRPNKIPSPKKGPASDALASLKLLPEIPWDSGFKKNWQPGESAAVEMSEVFLQQRLSGYTKGRDFPALTSTSLLSPALHFGECSPLQLVAKVEALLAEVAAAGVQANAEHFVRELAWREFAHLLLFHFPHTSTQPLNVQFEHFPWRKPADYATDLSDWQKGQTGIPIVDAGMRQLWHCGWMHNRVRMIVSSFLTKNLLIPWQEGARWFWDTLLDADLANNSLGWQWSAGSGADAAPYFRIFNPVLQSRKFDPGGQYLRRWIPELADLPDKSIHAPWEDSDAGSLAGKKRAGATYPQPIVDLASSRQRALNAYQALRAS